MLSDDLLESLRMPLNGFLTGFDEGFESQPVSSYVFASVGFSSLELTYVEAQEVEPHISVVRRQCVGDPGFAGFQFQAHVFEPVIYPFLYNFDCFEVSMENNQIIRIADNFEFPRDPFPVLYFMGRECRCDVHFQPMESHIRK